jgi:predicted nucleic acid-binding protein
LSSSSMVELLGPVRQEALSGIRDTSRFARLLEALEAFPDVSITLEDWERAAQCFNDCRAGGIQGSHIDMLLCSVGIRYNWPIFTLDRDFEGYAQLLPITLYESSSG